MCCLFAMFYFKLAFSYFNTDLFAWLSNKHRLLINWAIFFILVCIKLCFFYLHEAELGKQWGWKYWTDALIFFYFVNIKIRCVENMISFWFQRCVWHVSTALMTALGLRILNGVWPFAKTLFKPQISISSMKEKYSLTLLFISIFIFISFILPDIYCFIYYIYIVQHQLIYLLKLSSEIVLEAILWKCCHIYFWSNSTTLQTSFKKI